MVQNVDPFIHPIPLKIQSDPELRPFFEYFVRWAHDMWKRTGGGNDLVADTGTRESYPWELNESGAQDVSNVYDLFKQEPQSINQNLYPQIIESVKEITTKTISNETYTAVDNMFINMTNNSTLLLPANPMKNSVVYFSKDDSKATLRPNGKKINGTLSDIVFYKERLGRQIHYFIDIDEWFFI